MKALLVAARRPFGPRRGTAAVLRSLASGLRRLGCEVDTLRPAYASDDLGSWFALVALDLSRTPMDEPIDLLVTADLATASAIDHPTHRSLICQPVEPASEGWQYGARRELLVSSQSLARRIADRTPGRPVSVLHPPRQASGGRGATVPRVAVWVVDPVELWRVDLVFSALARTVGGGRVGWMVSGPSSAERIRSRAVVHRFAGELVFLENEQAVSVALSSAAELLIDLGAHRDLAYEALAALAAGIPITTHRDSGAAADLLGASGAGWFVEETPTALAAVIDRARRDVQWRDESARGLYFSRELANQWRVELQSWVDAAAAGSAARRVS